MPKAALQTTQRMMHKCPHCGDADVPKELVADGTSDRLLAFCSRCQKSFKPRTGIGCLGLIAIGFVGFVVLSLIAVVATDRSNQQATTAAPAADSPKAPMLRELTAEETAEAQKKAVALYPDLGVAGSPLNREFLKRLDYHKRTDPEFLRQPDWPSRLAREASKAVAH